MAAWLRSCCVDLEDDVSAVTKFGVTERQARFLVTVMRHRACARRASSPRLRARTATR